MVRTGSPVRAATWPMVSRTSSMATSLSLPPAGDSSPRSAQIAGAVEVDDGAAGPFRLRGGEVEDGGGDLLRAGHPAERALGADGLAAGRLEVLVRHVRLHEPRRDRRHRDAVRRQGDGERLGERVEARLAGAVGGAVGLAAEGAAGGDV